MVNITPEQKNKYIGGVKMILKKYDGEVTEVKGGPSIDLCFFNTSIYEKKEKVRRCG